MNKKPADVDLIASQSLANAKTAEEYVSKALEMKHKYDHSTPSSSFVKYDVYENQETKRVPTVVRAVTARPVVAQVKDDVEYIDGAKSSSDVHEYFQKPDYALKTTTTTTYKSPEDAMTFKDMSQSQSRFSPALASPYDAFNGLQFDSQKSFNHMFQTQSYPSKEEVYDYVERAVKKYMRELESEGKLSGVTAVTAAPSAHAEIKTYYRFPSSTAAPPTTTKLYSMGTHSEFFKPPKIKHKGVYSTVRPLTVESFTPDAIDLTFNGKKQKPIDLSALDVGQSWSHNPEPVVAIVPVNYHRPSKSKLHFNTQAYHDINSLPYAPERGLVYEENAPVSTVTTYQDAPSGHSSGSYKDHPVGASISFGGGSGHQEPEEPGKHHQFTPSLQVVNGVPVSNPYKFSMETLK